MKKSVIAKLTNKSRSYVSLVQNKTRENKQITDLLNITDEEFIYNIFSMEGFKDAAETALMKCKTKEGRLCAGQLLAIHSKLRIPTK